MTAPDRPDRPLVRLAVHRVPARAFEPPYDDEIDTLTASEVTDGTLALAFPLSTGVPAIPEPPARLQLVPTSTDPPTGSGDGGGRPSLAAPRQWAGRLVQAVVEVLAGDRPAAQLARWTTAGVYYDLQRMATRAARERAVFANRPMVDVVRSVHVTEPADGVAEVCALVSRGPRARALALRMEGRNGRWQCTALQLV